jgi:CO/xanthine dehydrogenase Mo-binding subunit
VSLNPKGARPGFGAHLCDVSVDIGTGHVKIER